MAPIKFEENIKDKLEERKLQPSENAWQLLEQQLDEDAKNQNKNKFWWLAIAAGFIGLLFVIQQFISFDASKNAVAPIVVESEKDVITIPVTTPLINKASQEIVQETSKQNAKLNANKNIKQANKNSLATTNTVIKTTDKKNKKVKQQAPIAVAKTEASEASTALNNVIISNGDLVASVVNTIDASEKNEVQVTALQTSESEIDALLKAANKNIQLTNNNAVNTVSIDANTLLEDVETEMPPSLRGQLFKVIEKNFNTAKTAVATRNE